MDYLEHAAAILNKAREPFEMMALKSQDAAISEAVLNARLRIAEGFAKLAAVDPAADTDARVAKALDIAEDGPIDGEHHKRWVIDQMVRALTGCPMITKTGVDVRGNEYTYEAQGESEEYLRFVRETGGWDEGIAP